MNGFGERLRKLRGEMKQTDAAQMLGINYSTYAMYEVDRREPNFDTLIKIASHYGVSTDYLLGLTECQTPDIDIQAICKKTGLNETAINNFKELFEEDPRLTDTAIAILSDFDNLFWITSSIQEMASYYSEIQALSNWMDTQEKNEEKGLFFIELHTRCVKEMRHAKYDCLESFIITIEKMKDEMAKKFQESFSHDYIDSRFDEWRNIHGEA